MSSTLIKVADAVAERINEADLSLPVTAVRSYADFDELLEDLGELHCDVIPAVNGSVPLVARGTTRYRCPVSVGLRKRFTQQETDGSTGRILLPEMDRLTNLLVEISELFHGQRLDWTNLKAAWQATDFTANFSRQHLRENRQFTGIVRLTFDAYVEVPSIV